jgi:hypothetical protein
MSVEAIYAERIREGNQVKKLLFVHDFKIFPQIAQIFADKLPPPKILWTDSQGRHGGRPSSARRFGTSILALAAS